MKNYQKIKFGKRNTFMILIQIQNNKKKTTKIERKKNSNQKQWWKDGYTRTIWDSRNVIYQNPTRRIIRREESKERQHKLHRDKKLKQKNRIQIYYKKIKIANHSLFCIQIYNLLNKDFNSLIIIFNTKKLSDTNNNLIKFYLQS